MGSLTISRHAKDMQSEIETKWVTRAIPRPGPALMLGLIGGLALPLVAAALYRTYDIAVQPLELEGTRQLGFVFLAGEIGLIVHRMWHGLSYRSQWRVLPLWARRCLGLFTATFWISSANVSPFPAFSLLLCAGWIIHLLFAGAVFDLATAVVPARRPDVWPGFVAGMVALAAVTAVHFTDLPPDVDAHVHQIDWGSAIPGFISVRLFGAWTAAVLSLLTGVAWVRSSEMPKRHLLFGMIAFVFGLMFWSATRAAVLGWIGVLPLAWFVAGPPRSRDMITVLPLYFIVAAVSATLLQPYDHPSFTFFDLLDPQVNASVDAISSLRLTFWTRSLAIVRDYPLFGTGAGSSWWLITLGTARHVQPHNVLVQFLLNWGLVPTIPALALLGGAVVRAHTRVRRERALLPLLMMLDSLLVIGLFDGMFHFAQFIMLIVGTLALCLAPAPAAELGHPM
jgi:hypothetical protein